MRERRLQIRTGSMNVPVQTWVQPEHENATLWRFMDFTKYVAMLHRRALRASLADAPQALHVGQVRHFDYAQEAVPDEHDLSPFFCKRKSFDYERELRVLCCTDEPVLGTGFYVRADLECLVDQIVIAPSAQTWLGELVESVTERYGPRLAITHSSLREDPLE
jgi:hypothetical protein